jgi:hypothetical protein
MSKNEELNSKDNSTPPKKEVSQTSQDDKEAMLKYMSRKAANRTFYLASALESYKQAEGLDEAGLGSFLEIEQFQLIRLALCGRPDVNNKKEFSRDVKVIATKFNIKPVLLANLLRVAAVYEANQQTPAPANNYLMAALDREDATPEIEVVEKNDD